MALLLVQYYKARKPVEQGIRDKSIQSHQMQVKYQELTLVGSHLTTALFNAASSVLGSVFLLPACLCVSLLSLLRFQSYLFCCNYTIISNLYFIDYIKINFLLFSLCGILFLSNTAWKLLQKQIGNNYLKFIPGERKYFVLPF